MAESLVPINNHPQAYVRLKEYFDEYLTQLYGSVKMELSFFEDPTRIVAMYAMYETFISDFSTEINNRNLRLVQGRDCLFELRETNKLVVPG